MARKIRAKLIMELRERGMSRRSIAKTRRTSMESVCEVFGIAEERGISWADVGPLTDEETYRPFYPDRGVRESVFEDPDWGYVHKEMAKVGVNLRLLHDEYRERCRREGKVAMGYTKFCGDYGTWTEANNLTKRIEHKAGRSCEVDWSGPSLGKGLVSPVTREVSKIFHYDVCEWAYNRSVGLDFHVVYVKNRYSVPHRYVGRKADLRAGESTPSIHHAGERIATRPLFPSYVRNAYSTDASHMPDAFVKPEWDDARIRGRARETGTSCAEVVERIFARVKVGEQAYNPRAVGAQALQEVRRREARSRLRACAAQVDLAALPAP